jgi:glycosyltransferase involved in cell wall biosynthesis
VCALLELRKLYKKYRPDIIHLHSSKAGILGRLAFPTKKTVYTVHGFDSIRVAHRSFLFLEKLMQYFCNAVVAVSCYDRKNLIAENIKNNLSIVYNGASVPDLKEPLSFGLPDKYKKIVLCVARISPQKNCALFLKVASLLPEYAFVWIGNQEKVCEHPENVFFMGNIPNAAVYGSIADVFFLPANYEGLPIVIIEAMSHGCPVVASDVGGVSELVRNDVNGYALENNAELFAEKIKYILENQQVRDNMSKASKEMYDNNFTVDKMVDGYKDVYNKILAKKSF